MMTSKHSLVAAIIAALLWSASAMAQTSWQLGIGGTRVLDTYLSQEHFSGMGMTFLSTTERKKADRSWATLIEHEVNIADVKDRSESCQELQGEYSLYIGRLRSWHVGHFLLQAGAMGCANIGFIYNTSNGNNPAQGRLSLHAMPSGAATYGFRLFRQQLSARYEVQLPLLGLMFSPNYGQSYYEIFSQGNYDHNIVPTTFVSAPNIRQQLSVDWKISHFARLRIGYLGNYQQSSVNNLKSHVYTHRLMIGIVRELKD